MSPGEIDILLVEDNEDDAALARHALETEKIAERLVHVKDGQEALEYLFARGRYAAGAARPRLVFLDLKLPKVDGHEVLQQVRADPRTKRLPVVMLTSSSLEEDVRRSYDIGVNSYLVKPVGFEQYVATVVAAGRYWLRHNLPPRP